MTEIPWESSPEDVAEQRAEVLPDPEDQAAPDRYPTEDLIPKADPADVADQLIPVPLDEDDWQ